MRQPLIGRNRQYHIHRHWFRKQQAKQMTVQQVVQGRVGTGFGRAHYRESSFPPIHTDFSRT